MNIKDYLKTNPRQERRSKYGNLKTEYNGYVYMSKKEANFAQELDYLKKATDPKERVVSFERQVPFQIEVNGKKICKYLCDFKVLYKDGHTEIIDVKGVRTNIYTLKKKLVEAIHGIVIKEV
jgi:hypothetical protein